MSLNYIWPVLAAGIVLAACDDETASLGIYTDTDDIAVSAADFQASSQTIKVDSVLGENTTCYFGQVTDPETKTRIKAEFVAQFHTFENYTLPSYDLIQKNEAGEIEADSVEIRLYYESFYGDSTNVMKMSVYELDTLNVLREDTVYYTDVKLEKYINPNRTTPLAKKMLAPFDYTVPYGTLTSSSYYKNIRIMLPKEYGTFILKRYYENPAYFKDSYSFAHHVCPGFYFKLTDGDGTMFYLNISTLSVYFSYKEKADSETTSVGVSRFAATPEVIQNTRFENSGIDRLIEESHRSNFTLLKTPAGAYTEVTLPVDEIYQGHESDSINKAEIAFTRYNNATTNSFALGTPTTLLMVRKQDMFDFFEQNKVVDNETSYVTAYTSQYNNYSFSNISRLVAYCMNEKRNALKNKGMSEADWVKEHPDWNKVVLIPVNLTSTSTSSQVSVSNNLGMNSVRLVGGVDPVTGKPIPIPLQVIYSKFNN
ncbi:MAG: DUF4270 domain-containing protein [Clostridium sp.]|nr:DUF4270 domain-containing protein [Clostridium sp.]